MRQQLLDELMQISEEESKYKAGQAAIEEQLYSEASIQEIDRQKLLRRGKLITVRRHSRFVEFPLHRHNYVEFMYVVQGEITHVIDGKELTLYKGDLLMLNQYVEHAIHRAEFEDIGINFIALPEFFEIPLGMLQEKNVLYLNLSSGVGAVNFFNGKMVVGRTGIAGEVGHITLNLHGPRCYCGNRGCFELYCGMNNIIVYAERLLTAENANDVFFDMAIQQHRPLTPELIFEAREEGSLIIHELLCNTAEYLGAGIASLFNIYDFDRMIISGYLDNGKDDFLINRAIEYAKGWIINPYSRDLIVSRAHLNSNQLYLALSALVLKHLLDDTFHA